MWNEPLFFDRNRVGRVYTGGKLFGGFFGDPAEDGFEPEEWIVSRVHAINKDSKGPHEGVSRVQGSGEYLDELLKQYPDELLGKEKKCASWSRHWTAPFACLRRRIPTRRFHVSIFIPNTGKRSAG